MVSTQHARFLKRLRGSSRAVFQVAWLEHTKGRRIEIPPLRYAPTAADADRYFDDGDLIVDGSRIEVKCLTLSFKGFLDFPYDDVYISNVAAVDRAGSSVLAYYIVSSDLRAMAVIPTKTRKDWYIMERRARNTGNVERHYAIKIDKVEFETLQ